MRNVTNDLEKQELVKLFNKFTNASSKLEARYLELQAEVEELKSELRVKNEEVRRNQRLAALGQAAAAIAHEVRNPLGALELFIGLLKPKVKGMKPCENLLSKMASCIKRLERVVHNILEFAADKKLTLSPVNLHNIIEDELIGCVVNNAKAVRFKTHFEGNPYILGEEQSLRQIFANLFSNSKKAMTAGGVISVTTSDDSKGNLIIEIKDNGPGIAYEILEKVFDPFVTGSKAGTGLGLALVKKLVLAHNGEIKAHNDNGAVFTLSFFRE